MAVYVVTELDNSLAGQFHVKIGRSRSFERRMSNLQTGNRRKIALLGHIRSASVTEDRAIERRLHHLFKDKVDKREWFSPSPEDVVSALKLYSSRSYISVGQDAFEIISYDRDAIPEFASPWQWGELNHSEFCPSCGWACGWTYSENYGGEVCLECGADERDYD